MLTYAHLRPMWILTLLLGCGPAPSIPGGTSGLLHADGTPLKEVRVTLFAAKDDSTQSIAFAVTDAEGAFQLREEATLEGVWLEPGEYRVTLESAGEFRMIWPREYTSPQQTPLKVAWTAEQTQLELHVPTPKIAY